jgi:thymidylate synthase (FAD)
MKTMSKAVVLTSDPVVTVLAEQKIDWSGVEEMTRWVNDRRPECVPDEAMHGNPKALFPHDMMRGGIVPAPVTDNELLAELAGRKCYDSFGAKAGRKSNADYIANTQQGDIPHASIVYHAKMTFFFAGISRRVSHELIRNYVGSDRDEEGAPSQESTRYVEHAGRYIMHPRDIDSSVSVQAEFINLATRNYDDYLCYIRDEIDFYKLKHDGAEPKGMDRKRIYEAASARLVHSCETSWIWTSNPIALAKMIRERANEGADLEFQRFAKKLAHVCLHRWPNLFTQPWVKEAAWAHEGYVKASVGHGG